MRNIPYNDQDNDIVHWVIIIFHKKEWDRDKYLVVQNKFVFWPKKKERAGKKAIYHVFLADWSTFWSITTTRELTSAVWMTKKEVLNTLTFDDVKDVFEKAIKEIII